MKFLIKGKRGQFFSRVQSSNIFSALTDETIAHSQEDGKGGYFDQNRHIATPRPIVLL